nr:hypothetical protein [Oceaniglobus indicus]
MQVRRGRPGVATTIKAILALQLAMAAVMFGSDIAAGLQGLSFTPPAPRLDEPARPGDQTRRYRPRDAPEGPADRPFPPVTDMPQRLQFEVVAYAGRPAMRLTGEIAPGDAVRFTDRLITLEAAPEVVLLNSTGGSVVDALQIGRALRDGGFETELTAGDVCLSACPYILAAGTERRVDPQAYVGVHQHYFGQNTILPAFLAVEDIQRGQGEVMAYLDDMGLDPLLMRHALVTPPNAIYVFLPDELTRYRIVTGTTDGDAA